MFVKLQHPDTSCLRILNSTGATPPSVGISLAPSFKKPNDKIKHKQQKQILECPDGGGRTPKKKTALVEGPRAKIDKRVNFGGGFGARGGVFNGGNVVIEEEDTKKDVSMETLNERVLLSAGEVNGVVAESRNRGSLVGKSDVYRRGKIKPNSGLGKLQKSNENYGNSRSRVRSVGVVEGMHTKCSTKWARYGGSIPAMLEALETFNDLEEALRPWEMTLTNKERSILLKEQLSWERAKEIFEWFKRKGCYEVNVIHYNIMIKILEKARKWCEIERLWGDMWKRGIKPVNSTYGTLIDVYCKGGLREKAMKWLDLMNEENLEPDEVTMGIVVQMHKKAVDFKAAEEFFKKWSCSKHVNSTSLLKKGANGNSSPANICLSTHTYNTP